MYKKTTLDNGLRIVTESIPYMSSVSLGIFVGTGSRSEAPAEQGVSHFIEHLLFKGTTKRSARDIAETVDDVGGQLNAATDRENTCYYIKVLPEHLGLGMDVLSDMLLHSKFAEADVEKERQVVLEEISLYEDSPDELIHDLYMNSLWPKHSLGRNILGTRDTIGAMSRQMIVDYTARYYEPDNIVVAAAGNLTHDRLVELTRIYWENRQGTAPPQTDMAPAFVAGRLLQEKDIEQVHICLGTPGVAQDSAQYYAAHVLNTILGGGVSSRLFQSIREERGLAYSVCSYPSSFRDTGLLTIYTGVSPENSREVMAITHSILGDIREHGVRPDELQRAKEQLKAGLMFSLESSASRMSRLGRAEISCREYLPPEKLAAKVDEVSLQQLFELAQPLFRQDSTCLTALGPIGESGPGFSIMSRTRGFEITREYSDCGLKLPLRSTKSSAGYDIAAAENVCLQPGEMAVVPTGLKAYMLPDEFLGIHIRSSLAVRHRLYLANSQGIIDSDYYDNPDNEGHILVAIVNGGTKEFSVNTGMRFAQGIFCKYLLADQDVECSLHPRVGGIGSTGT